MNNLMKFTRVTQKFEVDRSHAKIAPFPTVKHLNFAPLNELCDSFNWNEPDTVILLEAKLKNDARWMGSELYNKSKLASRKEEIQLKIEYAKANFKKMVGDIENESIETGEPLNYGVLKNYLGFIAEKLPHAPKQQKTQILLQLAVEGGDYCGPGIYYQLETAATALLRCDTKVYGSEERPRLPLKQRILLILQQERMNIMSAYHFLMAKQGFMVIRGKKNDIHSINYNINWLGDGFYLPDQGASNDRTAITSIVDKITWQFFYKLKPEDLWQNRTFLRTDIIGYTPVRVTDAIMHEIGIPLIPANDIRTWAREWIEKKNLAEEQKGNFLEMLQDGESFEKNLKFQLKFIEAMLVDMGILKIKT